MCSGCGQCGGAKPTRVSEASDLEPEAALIQLAGLESGRQAWTANGSEQPCEVKFLREMVQGSSYTSVDETVPKDPMLGFRNGKSHPNH